MKSIKYIISILSLSMFIALPMNAEEVFEHTVGESLGSSILGVDFDPVVHLNLTGLLESDTPVSDLATNEHDPSRDYQVHPIELHTNYGFSDQLRGAVHVTALESMDKDWEMELEQVKLTYDLNDSLSITGGQFLNRFGFANEHCVHAWDFVNQHLQNSRFLNEGELITRGISVDYTPSSRWSFNFSAGKARVHEHDHGHHGHGDHHDDHGDEHHDDHDDHEGEEHDDHEGEEHDDHEGEEHDDHEGEEHHDDHEGEEHGDHDEHHMEADGINISDVIGSADVRYYLDDDRTTMISGSLAVGENEFGTNTWLYGIGLQKLWGGHDHGNGQEFCSGSIKLKAEAIGRSAEVKHEDGDSDDVSDWGFYASIFYGLDEMTTISARHGYVSELEELELEDRNRTSLALSRNLSDNVLARIQYDYNRSDSMDNEHAIWLQFKIAIGTTLDCHANCNH
ncbi:MAG: hypothetical protein CMO36_09770 [Verrucomicrobiaceae bacterium]|nr:hypothetical protein [Verrucomicrobiaceae bacterium]